MMPYRLHAVHEMRPISTDVSRSVVCVSVCVLDIRVSCAKTAEPIDMVLGRLTHIDPRNHVLDGKDPTGRGMCRNASTEGECACREGWYGDAASCQITLDTSSDNILFKICSTYRKLQCIWSRIRSSYVYFCSPDWPQRTMFVLDIAERNPQ